MYLIILTYFLFSKASATVKVFETPRSGSPQTPGVIHDLPLLVSIYVNLDLLLGTTLRAAGTDGLSVGTMLVPMKIGRYGGRRRALSTRFSIVNDVRINNNTARSIGSIHRASPIVIFVFKFRRFAKFSWKRPSSLLFFTIYNLIQNKYIFTLVIH